MPSITYILRKIDILEFNEYHAKMNSAYGNSIKRHQMIWPGVVVLIAFFIVMSTEKAQTGMYLLVAAFVWSLMIPAWLKKRFHQHVLEQLPEEDIQKVIGEYSLKVTEEGLLETSPSGEELIDWSSIIKIEQSKHHTYLYMGESSAITIPTEMLSEESDFKEFYDGVVTAVKTANGTN
ncbi:MAG: hypothetical protein COB22_01980 [Cycloclasticus sp.]|nr:MAG: hypothetical protein COB22_01980 [Cycloclasticus sp.]